jgi:UPF0176 protein
MLAMQTVLNVSGYAFVELSDALALRERLHAHAALLRLKGTVILAGEGINVALAGEPAALRGWIGTLCSDSRFAAIEWKFSQSDALPFRRLVVKVKREIIRMNQSVVRPEQGRAPSVDAATLARWLGGGCDDAGRDVVLLDTRNGFEVDHGRFHGALDWRLRSFSDFPRALRENRAELEGKTVVSYCTGGIRCEKAALWMRREGIHDVVQLEGGILRYFEAQGAAHFEGSCFVFDERVCLDGALASVSPA